MPARPMDGVRVVEVAQFTYVPAAGAVLADWGAEVIKIEHAETGDAQRGFGYLGSVAAGGSFAPLMEHPNRGKRSVGLALEKPEALEVLHEIVRRSDVFVTNFLPDARARLKIDVDDIRAVNPDIIYVRVRRWVPADPRRTRVAMTRRLIGAGPAARRASRHRSSTACWECQVPRTETRSAG